MALLTSHLVLDTVILASGVLLLFYVKFFFNYQYWKKRNIPYLSPNFPLGNITYTRPMHIVFQELYNKVKFDLKLPFCGIYTLASPQLMLTDQELIKQVLIKDFDVFTDRGIFQADKDDEPLIKNLFRLTGDEWRRLRNKMSPTFTSGRIKEMFPLIDSCGKNLVSVLTKNLNEEPGMKIDVKDYLARYQTEVIASSVFGMETNVVENPDCEFNQIIRRMVSLNWRMRITIALTVAIPKIREFIKFDLMDKVVTRFFFDIVRENIAYREAHNIKRNDFVNIMMQMKKSDPDFTEDFITAQCFVFFLAGFDTASTVLAHCLHALANNKDLQSKLRQEVWKTKAKYGGELTYEAYQEMHMLDRVIKESLRLYAPLPQLNRTNSQPWTIPNTDITLEPNTQILIPLYGIHLDPEIYPNPTQFDPDRFKTENVDNMPHYAWMPFGEGPRNCIGKRFGMVQLKSGLAILVSNFEWNPDPANTTLTYSKGIIDFRLAKPMTLKSTPVSQINFMDL